MDDRTSPLAEQVPPLQQLEGTLERLTYQNEQNGYTVARFTPKGKRYEVTVVGAMAGVNIGESMRLSGQWVTHAEYGRQFEVQHYTVQLPATIEGIRKYLGSGLIQGIGPVMAERIVEHFGLNTLDVIDGEIERLHEVPGIGKKRVGLIRNAWAEQQEIKEIMIFLQAHQVSTTLAVKIYKQYGDQSVSIVRADPYRLAQDIFGIGFKTADSIAQKLGLPVDAPERVRAGLIHALNTLVEEGHVFATREQLVPAASELLEVEPEFCELQLDFLLGDGTLIASGDEGAHIYLPPFFYAEGGIANKIRLLLRSSHDRLDFYKTANWPAVFDFLDERNPFTLSDRQKEAVQLALTEPVVILTGGPGTGKSTVTGTILQLLRARNKEVLLAAPTGRAAKRLSEATGHPAQTIHRLLEFKPSSGQPFLRDRFNPLESDLIIVDEASMIDTLLMNSLLKAVSAGTHLLLVGDIDQLPSVGAGNVLRDLIASQLIPTVTLDQIYRQSADSYIIVNAHRINMGKMPRFEQNARDFFYFNATEPLPAAELVIDIVSRRLPQKFGYDPLDEIQVLSPMHRGSAGVGTLNEGLQTVLNPPAPTKRERKMGHRLFREGDRVMQIRNNYDLNVFNGDMGRIKQLDGEAQMAVVNFDGVDVPYEYYALDQLVHAYAVSVHKSQGSEYPVVVMPLLMQHYMLLQRNLLYTGITRAREMVVLVGSKRAIAVAVRNDQIAARNTALATRLSDPTLWEQSAPLYEA
ncbi:MAG: ATP-dependent RecD-like DNA helicase [Anaerolineales bacterium]|nr:ATP-dependent RecD-like DNA helicase [Anaerolineales bacterium]MCB9128281.1 ATP-dependent RecD-like DNA helicase [Ardenticatenales bacterium]MCB9172072.1 ATP-dependent RecD-like DNA helicase [Ardenticatenales bacterium]